jgi:hypothetical protein
MKSVRNISAIFLVLFILTSLGFNFFNNNSILTWLTVTIQQIQYKSNDSLTLGKDKSDMLDDSVIFVGRVVAPPRVSPAHNDFRTLLRGSNSWTCYMQDTANGVFGGMVVRQGSRGPTTGLDLIDTGAIIRVRGVVQEFPATGYSNPLTQVGLDTAAGYTIEPITTAGNRPAPKLVNITDFASGDYTNGGTINYVGGEKYEGMYVEIRNVTVSSGVASRQPFSIVDENGNKLLMRDFSNFFSLQPSETLRVWSVPYVGTYVNYIRGVIISANNEGVFGTQLPYAICPIYPNDFSIGNAPPIISNPTRTPGVPTPSDSVLVACSVTDPAMLKGVSNVQVYWRQNNGAFTSKTMTATGSIYSAKMPPASLNTFVEYYIKATDTASAVKLLPSDTAVSKLFYIVKASDSMSIQEVQYCPNRGGRSGFEGAYVRGIEGIVTSDTSDIRAFSYTSAGGTQTSPRRVIIQNGTGALSGIWLFGNPTDILHRGDKVRVRGTVEENFSVTRISVSTPSDITVLSTGNPIPSPQNLTTAQLANNKLDGDTTVEKWESVYVRFNIPVWISCVNAGSGISCTSHETLVDTAFRRNYGEILVKDNSNIESRIELQDGGHTFTNNWDGVTTGKTLLTQNDSIYFVQGIFFYSFGNYKIVPRKNTDFGTVVPVGISNNTNVIENYALYQNYPNPFNPVTIIKFSIPENSKVKLTVFDVLGREVNTLVNQNMMQGTYTVNFDGTNLSSGVYFYKLATDNFTDTKRMLLIK